MLPAGIALTAGEANGLLDAWASSPRKVYACLRVIRQRPSESTASDRCSRCSRFASALHSYRYLGVPTRWNPKRGVPCLSVHVGLERRGVPDAASDSGRWGSGGLAVQGSRRAALSSARTRLQGRLRADYLTQRGCAWVASRAAFCHGLQRRESQISRKVEGRAYESLTLHHYFSRVFTAHFQKSGAYLRVP